MKQFLTLFLSLTVAASAIASAPLMPRSSKSVILPQLRSENVESSTRATKAVKLSQQKPVKATKSFAPVQAVEEGEILVQEDFSKFTAGSESQPDAVDLCDSSTGEIPSQYTQAPAWGGVAVYQAGGCAYLGRYYDTQKGDYQTGLVYTPDMDATSGMLVTFRARSASSEGDQLFVEYNVFDATAGGQNLDYDIMNITGEWKEYTVAYNAYNSTNVYLCIYSMVNELYIDDVKVVSGNSQVETIEPPVMRVTAKADGFVAEWDATEKANVYDFWAYEQHSASADGSPVYLINTNFDEIESTGTLGNPELPSDIYHTLDFLPGWILWAPAYMNGAIGINDVCSLYGQSTCFESPEFDLSGTDGTVKIDVDIYTSDDVAIALLNKVGNQWSVVDQKYEEAPADEEPLGWKTYSLTLNGNPTMAAISILGNGYNYTWIDNMKVSVDLKADGKLLIPINNTVTQGNSVEVKADMAEGKVYACTVRGGLVTEDASIVGDFAEMQYVYGKGGSVAKLASSKTYAFVAGGKLHVVNPDNAAVAVYNTNGSLISAAAESEIELPGKGVYIVKIGDKAFKVVK